MTSLMKVQTKAVEFEAMITRGPNWTGPCGQVERHPAEVEGLTGAEPLRQWYRAHHPDWMLYALIGIGLITNEQAESVAREVGDYEKPVEEEWYGLHGFEAPCLRAAQKAADEFGPEAAKVGMACCGYHEWLDRTSAVNNAMDDDGETVETRQQYACATRAAFAAYWDVRHKQLAAVRALVDPRQILDALAA